MSLQITAQARYAFLRELMDDYLHPGASVVELGAAPGDQIAAIADAGFRTTAVDIGESSDGWSDGTEGRMRALFNHHGVEYVQWNLEQVPYPLPDSTFDAVVFTEVFEHLRDYPATSLHECYRLLKPNGRLFFTTPNAAYVMNRVRLMAGRSVYTPLPDWIGGVPHARHAREYLISEVQLMMKEAGLDIEFLTCRHFHTEDVVGWRRRAKEGIDRVSRHRPTLGPCMVIVARRSGS